MANVLYANPLILDTDLASFQANQTLTAATELLGLRVRKIALYVNSTSVAGTVTVTDPVTTNPLHAPMVITASQAAGTILFTDDFGASGLTWEDFKVTGLTATSTKLMIWYGR